MQTYDFLIIGAGIMGLTTAHELKKRYPEANIAILEKEDSLGMHASGRNSGVLHSGIYYGSDTLKARLCSKGAERMREFAQVYGISCNRSGKVIIASCEQDLPVVERLLANAKVNNISAIKMDEAGIKKIEPHANPYKVGIYSPDTTVIDSTGVLRRLQSQLQQQGTEMYMGQEVVKAKPEKKVVVTRNSQYGYGYLFNCAGAYADVIARKFELARDYVLLPFKGIYYRLRPEKSDLVKGSIYPIPDISLPFLGVHLTRVISGEVYVGPTAIPALGRENYGIIKGIKLGEGAKIGWTLAEMYFKNQQSFRRLVHSEASKYLKVNIVKATRRLVPEVASEDLIPANKIGIRPQLVNLRTKKLEMDFIIEQASSSIHVLNAISPAFTSAFAFSELLVTRVSS